MALIDIHVPDERITAYLEVIHGLHPGNGTLDDIVAAEGRITLTLTYEVGQEALEQLARAQTPLAP